LIVFGARISPDDPEENPVNVARSRARLGNVRLIGVKRAAMATEKSLAVTIAG
jgi:hypothetical protein